MMSTFSLDKFIWTVYFLVLVVLVNSGNSLFFWFMLECNMVSFILLCFFSHSNSFKVEGFDVAFFYFMVQSLGSLFFLVSISWAVSLNFLFSEDLTLLALCLKSGLFPFFSWIYSSIEFFSFLALPLLLSLQKIPLYLFLFSLGCGFLLWVLLLSMMIGVFYLFSLNSWPFFLLSSSVYGTFWIFGVFELGFSFYFQFFALYSFFLLLFSTFYYFKFVTGVTDFVTFSSSFLFFMGLPPLSMFFFKMFFIQWAFISLSESNFILLWVLVFFSLFGYFKFLYKGFFPLFNFYKGVSSFVKLSILMGLALWGLTLSFSSKLFKLLGSYLK